MHICFWLGSSGLVVNTFCSCKCYLEVSSLSSLFWYLLSCYQAFISWITWLQHYGGDARDLALDFTVTEELFGKHYTVELRPGGADMVVTNENKLQYVHAMADYKLNRQVSYIFNLVLCIF